MESEGIILARGKVCSMALEICLLWFQTFFFDFSSFLEAANASREAALSRPFTTRVHLIPALSDLSRAKKNQEKRNIKGNP